jgi:cytosine/adenosine deaminase-related metal-dependent hydrolase
VPATVSLINADLGAGSGATLRIRDGRLIAGAPQARDLIIDLRGDRVLPGLVNAHDHLQWNSFPPLNYPSPYTNASAWAADTRARVRREQVLSHASAQPRAQRYLAGGLKNLLSGVTTVAHHDPLHPVLRQRDFPCRVLEEFGWSHSLHIDGAQRVQAAHRATPAQLPWIIHAAEGTDAEAAAEFEQLEALGCIGARTLLVHGVALDAAQRTRLTAAGAALVWCPSSNLRLFGRTAAVSELVRAGRVALGSDSRLTGARDLLDEVRAARGCLELEERVLESLVTDVAARLLRLGEGAGTLAVGARADLVVLPAGMPLWQAQRSDLRLVMLGGAARYGDEDYTQRLGAAGEFVALRVDGRGKRLHAMLAALLINGQVSEAGVELPESTGRALCG